MNPRSVYSAGWAAWPEIENIITYQTRLSFTCARIRKQIYRDYLRERDAFVSYACCKIIQINM